MDNKAIEWLTGDKHCQTMPQTAEMAAAANEMEDINPAIADCGIILDCQPDASATVTVKMSKNNIWMKIKSSADDFIFFFIGNIILYKKTDTHQAYNVVRLAKLLGVSQPTLSRVYAMYNWGGIEKGEKYLSSIDILHESLRTLLFNGKVSIQIAVQFGLFFAEDDYDELLTCLQPLTFSEMNQNLQYIIEIAKQNGDLHKTLALICEMIAGCPAKVVSEKIYRMRYPQRAELEGIYNEFVGLVKLNNRVTASFLLEKQQYSLNVTFKDSADLIRQLDNIRQRLSNVKPDDDMFILDNIFKKSEMQGRK
ncbi:MAG: hypothetical protein IKN25_00105 [Spirochaetales bacterium]|nr:hypothetical protein [Spirochaetales bacterium]